MRFQIYIPVFYSWFGNGHTCKPHFHHRHSYCKGVKTPICLDRNPSSQPGTSSAVTGTKQAVNHVGKSVGSGVGVAGTSGLS